jgi:hypothetical protein
MQPALRPIIIIIIIFTTIITTSATHNHNWLYHHTASLQAVNANSL